LQKVYRSHPTIVALSSLLFYDNKLQFCNPPDFDMSLCGWEGLKNQNNFPLQFFGVSGEDKHIQESGSFYNLQEVEKVVELVISLMKSKNVKVNPQYIGIITPYKEQVKQIRHALRKKKLPEIHVGNVDNFQGQEEKIIIVSTVRSDKYWLKFDKENGLGLVNSPKKINVCLTRAKSMLLVVGNPITLMQDSIWNIFINFCYKNSAYEGIKIDNLIIEDFPDIPYASTWTSLGQRSDDFDEQDQYYY